MQWRWHCRLINRSPPVRFYIVSESIYESCQSYPRLWELWWRHFLDSCKKQELTKPSSIDKGKNGGGLFSTPTTEQNPQVLWQHAIAPIPSCGVRNGLSVPHDGACPPLIGIFSDLMKSTLHLCGGVAVQRLHWKPSLVASEKVWPLASSGMSQKPDQVCHLTHTTMFNVAMLSTKTISVSTTFQISMQCQRSIKKQNSGSF